MTRRVLLVGLTPLTARAVAPRLAEVADVTSVAFPGTDFDHAAEHVRPDLAIVEVTYLDAAAVRPLITHRLLSARPLVVYVGGRGGAWFDDLRALATGPLPDAGVDALVELADGAAARRRLLEVTADRGRAAGPAETVVATERGSTPGAIVPLTRGTAPKGGAAMLEYIMARFDVARDEDGQALVEYALILGLISVVAIAALTAIGGNVNRILTAVNAALNAVTP